MNSYERVMTCIAGKKPDRVPVIPIVREWACKQAGIPFVETMDNVEKHVYSQYYSAKEFGYDAVFDLSGVHAESEAMGSVVQYGPGRSPTVVEPAIRDYGKDLPRLGIFDPLKDGRLPLILEEISRLKELCSREIPVIGYVQGPFRHAAMLRGPDQWMVDLFKDQENARNLMEISLNSQIVWGTAVAQAGADIITIADPFSSGSVISRKTFSEWSLPHMENLCRAIQKTRAKTYLHVCGDISDRLQELISVGADILQVDSKVDLGTAREVLGPDPLLMGNIDPTSPLTLGTPEVVYEHSKKAIELAGKKGRLILSGGCMVSEEVPDANMRAMIRAAVESVF